MNNIWLIGASEGIGEALLNELISDADNKIIISARNEEKLNNLASLDKERIACLPLDVTDIKSIEKASALLDNSKIDMVIYCAGYYKPLSCATPELEEAIKMIDVNLLGAFRVLQPIIPKFIKQNSGHIVLIGSVAGFRGLPNAYGYGAGKAGIIHLAENLKCDLAKYNIKVQIINPGFVKTRLTDLNNFKMPSIISAQDAAKYIVRAMETNKFESSFPLVFSILLKLLSLLPYKIYFWFMRFVK